LKLRKKPIPLYCQVERVLRKRIMSGTFASDRPFPTEKELCEEFGVSRTTVRQALMILESNNFIRREQGRGTFVNRQENGPLRYQLYGTLEDLLLLGARTTLVLKEKTLIEPTADMVRDMRLEPDERLWLFEGLRFYEGHKAFFQAYVPEDMGWSIEIEELESPYFIQRVERAALDSAVRAHQITSAALADERLSGLLGVARGHPLLVVKRTYFTKTERALEMAITHFPGDTYQSTAELVRTKS